MVTKSLASSTWHPLRPLLWSVLVWLIVAILMTTAMVSDLAGRSSNTPFLTALTQNLPFFIPLVVLNWFLSFWFDGPQGRGVLLRDVLPVLLPVFFLFFPGYLVYEAALITLRQGDSLTAVWATLDRQSRFNWWVDLMVVACAFAFQVALTARRLQQEQATALLQERNHSLSLRLALLQGQLEPHFLFNALNSISSLVRSGDRGDALAALARVSELLRFALRASQRPWVSVSDERAFIDAYLNMQCLRLGDRLKIDQQIAEADWDLFRCPPLLFQPLVENAIRHGVEPTLEPVDIRISLSLDGEMIKLAIENPFHEPISSHGHGMGLILTRQRLAALYGNGASLTTERAGTSYYTVLAIPMEDLDATVRGPDR